MKHCIKHWKNHLITLAIVAAFFFLYLVGALASIEHADEPKMNLVNVFHDALKYFEKRNWTVAAEGFNEALLLKSTDEPSRMYAGRCENFIKKPPEDKWDGVYNLTSK
jgi:hypothetical protein